MFNIAGPEGNVPRYSDTAIHGSILRGPNDETLVLHFGGDHNSRLIRIPKDSTLYSPSRWSCDSCQLSVLPPAGGIDMFCGGHAAMADGRLMVGGGTETGTNGHRQVRVFDPFNYLNANHGWSYADSTQVPRWYPTLTTLGDGSILNSSGLQYFETLTFGGDLGNNTQTSERFPLAMERSPRWLGYSSITDPRVGDALTTPASARTDHGADYSDRLTMPNSSQRGAVVIFGGRSGSSTSLGDLWLAWRTGYSNQDSWYWRQLTGAVNPAPPAPYSNTLPSARSEHGQAIWEDFAGGDTVRVYVYGGRSDTTGLSDLWEILIGYRPDPNAIPSEGGSPRGFHYYARQVTTAGQGPGGRYGHVMVFDPGRYDGSGNTTNAPRLLVFGGRTSQSVLADSSLYALDLKTYTWTRYPRSGAPSPRYKARAAFIPVTTQFADTAVMILFGGESRTGNKLGDRWRLTRTNAAGDTSYKWTAWTDADAAKRPSARAGHTLTWDAQWNRVVVTGGRDSVGLKNDVWFLPAAQGDMRTAWTQISSPGSGPAAKQGHTATYYGQYVCARNAERIAADGSGTWSTIDAPHLDEDTYPYLFLLPSGNIFYAGRTIRSVKPDNSYYDLRANGSAVLRLNQPTPSWSDYVTSGFKAGSAVMYRPGKILKCGMEGDQSGKDSASFMDLTSSEADARWVSIVKGPNFLLDRYEQNLVMLPTGDVLATGGRLTHEPSDTHVQRTPQIFSVADTSWGIGLADDPSTRGYHSTALVMPDGRILSMGGSGSDSVRLAAVFEPPYLFSSGSTYASRPAITSSDATMCYGQTRWVGTDRAATIRSVALLRPGATTHAFDQNQRYVPLTFSADVANNRLLVTLPANGNLAPPGDYMLFLVDSLNSTLTRVPSMARWVRLKQDTVAPDSLPVLLDSEVVCDQAWFSFVATADDHSLASSGTAGSYDFRYLASSATTPPAFASMTQASGEPAPAVSGTTQGFSFTNLAANTWYWFALRSVDVCGNTSTISAFRSRTLAAAACSGEEFVCVHCNSGGGGNRPAEGPTSIGGLAVAGPSSPSILDGATPDQEREDLIPVDPGLAANGSISLTMRSAGSRAIDIDRVQLMLVDHDPDDLVIGAGTSLLTGRPTAATAAWVDDSVSTPGLVEGGLLEPAALAGGQSVRLQLASSAQAARTLLVDCARPGDGILPPEGGLEVEARDALGTWYTVGHVYPRMARTLLATPGVTGTEVRLTSLGDVQLWGLSELLPASAGSTVTTASVTSATSASAGDALAAVASNDGARLDFTGPDTLSLTFALPAAVEGQMRSMYLAVRAQVGPAPGNARAQSQRSSAEPPLSFALHQSRPNPARGGASIPFDLPMRAWVTLELFDLQGRRVMARVAELPAGRHEWTLGSTNAAGVRLAPGLYSYRLRAGGASAEKKLVVLP